VAIQNNSELPVLELANLHGDTIATASYLETATELASKADTSEFGVPTLTLPPKYSWLGSIELATEELPSGAIDMGARSYVPEIGRFLQPDPVSGGSANAYSYTFGDPVNSSDPTGDYTASYVNAFDEEWAAGASERQAIAIARMETERHAAEEAAARAAAEIAAQQAALAAQSAAGPQWGEEEWEEWEEWWEEEGGYEEAAYHPGTGGQEEGHVEPAILVQPLSGKEASSEGAATTFGSPAPMCTPGSNGPCARDAGGVRGNCGGNARCKAYRSTHPFGSNVPSAGDTFCQAAGVPSLIRAVAGSPVGVFVAVGCAAKGVYELAGGH
jgi:RHS repeat-associated protein